MNERLVGCIVLLGKSFDLIGPRPLMVPLQIKKLWPDKIDCPKQPKSVLGRPL